jgi:hypothetical protein
MVVMMVIIIIIIIHHNPVSVDSSVNIETGYGLNGRNSIPGRDKKLLYSPQHPHRL